MLGTGSHIEGSVWSPMIVGEEIDGKYQVYEHFLKTKLVFKCFAIYNRIQHFGISPCN